MRTRGKHRHGGLTPVMVAVFVAVVGQTVILLNDFGPGRNLTGSGSATMITAAALSRVGAIEISAPPSPPTASLFKPALI